MLLVRIFSWIMPLLVAATQAALFWQYRYYYWLFIGSLAIIFLSLWLFARGSRQVKGRLETFFYILPAWFLCSGTYLFLLLLENNFFKAGLIVFNLGALLIYYDFIFSRLYKNSFKQNQPAVLPFNFLETATIFLVTTGFFGLGDFLNVAVWLLVLAALVFGCLFSWVNDFIFQSQFNNKNWLLHVVAGIIAAELFWAVLSLPFVYYLKAFLFTFVYLIFTLLRDSLYYGYLNKKIVKAYLLALVLIFALILSTARWF